MIQEPHGNDSALVGRTGRVDNLRPGSISQDDSDAHESFSRYPRRKAHQDFGFPLTSGPQWNRQADRYGVLHLKGTIRIGPGTVNDEQDSEDAISRRDAAVICCRVDNGGISST